MSRAWHSLLFFAPTALNGLVTLAAIPILIHSVGGEAWARIAVGQAVGSVAMTLISYGWVISGPATVGVLAPELRSASYAVSVTGRLFIALPSTAAAVLVTWLVVGEVDPLAGSSAAASALLGLSASWFFIGTNRPIPLLTLDTAPRILTVVAGLVLAVLTGNALLFTLSQILGVVVGLVASWLVVVGPSFAALRSSARPAAVGAALREQSTGVLASLGFAAFAYAPLPLVTLLLPGISVEFAIVDKVQKLLITAVSPVAFVLVARMAGSLRGEVGDRARAARSALRASVVTGLVAAVAAGIAAAVLVPIASAGRLELSWWLIVLLGLMVSAGFLAQMLPVTCLAPIGRVPSAVRATIAGIIVLAGLIVLAGALLPTLVAALGIVVVASLLIVSVEVGSVLRTTAPHARRAGRAAEVSGAEL